MAHAIETYLIKKVNGRGAHSSHVVVPKRWAKDKHDHIIGCVYFDLTSAEDREQYEKARLEIEWS